MAKNNKTTSNRFVLFFFFLRGISGIRLYKYEDKLKELKRTSKFYLVILKSWNVVNG